MRTDVKNFKGSIIAALCFFTISNFVISQNQRPVQDIRRVIVTSEYVLSNGQKTDHLDVVYQEIYDSLGRLHTEIDYSAKDLYPHNYIWHSFKGKLKIKSEIFRNEKLSLVKEYSYNKDSLLTMEVIKSVKPSDTSVYITLNYKYNSFRKPIQIVAKTAINKTAYTSKSTYDLKGTELTRRVRAKKGYSSEDSILKMSCKPRYDSIGRLIGNYVNYKKTDKKTYVSDLVYKYNKNNNIIGITINNDNGKLISKEERIFREDNPKKLGQIKYYDSGNKVIKWIVFRYEIYRNKIRLQREIDF